MAEALISFAAETILKKLVSTIAEEISLAWGMKENLTNMIEKSRMILAMLNDAERRQIKDEAVIRWLKRLTDTVYDADDVVDNFRFEMLRRKMEIQIRMKNKIRNFFTASNPIAFRFKMAPRVKDITMMLEKVIQDGTQLGLHHVLYQAVETTRSDHGGIAQTHFSVDDSKVLGRKADKSILVNKLLHSEDEEDLSVVAIVGLAGLGKTTLAQLIYKDEDVSRHFVDERIWVCVSDAFDVERILKQMADCLQLNVGSTSNIAGLIKRLQDRLKSKQYLLVLDDVWNTYFYKWESVRNSLIGIGVAKKSKILVTTRNSLVASTMNTTFAHHLTGLSERDSWTLFRQRAFATGGSAKETPPLIKIGTRLVIRCKGVPLAINTLGGLMFKKDENEWSAIEESELWDLSSDESGIMSALKLSFNHLPSPCLKQCFAYCSIFPKDVELEKDNLILLWIAQGFVHPSPGSNATMEDTGNDYFKHLLWISFFQDVETDIYENIKKCKMHDLVHNLALSISKSECLVLDASRVSDGVKARHLSLIENEEKNLVIIKENAAKLRTLFVARDPLEDFFRNFKCLRVLNFEGSYIRELPESIGKLKSLRYLNVSKTDIKVFPTSIVRLYNLQTIRFMGSYRLVELPEELRSLISLTHLCFDDEYGGRMRQMPIEMGRLTSLKTLPRFVVGHDKGRQIEELGSLNKLRGELVVTNLERVKDKDEAKKANLLTKTDLFKLSLRWSSERNGGNTDEEVLEGLQPPPNLGSLTIEGFDGSCFPTWMLPANVHNNGNSLLVEIRLKNCRKCEQIPTLGELPCLKFLELEGINYLERIGAEFYSSNIYSSSNQWWGDGESSSTCCSGSGGGETTNNPNNNKRRRPLFPKLEKFTLKDMSNLIEWTEAAAATAGEGSSMVTVEVFPCLEELTIQNCKELTTAPTHFPSLKKLAIRNMESGVPIAKITSSRQLTTTLTSLRIESVLELTHLPEELLQTHHHVFLQELFIQKCPKLSSIPNIRGLTSLRRLIISECEAITNLPMGLCTSLVDLTVRYCPNLIWVAEGDLRKLKSLSLLSIHSCGKLIGGGSALEGFLHCLTHLRSLEIGRFWEELDSFPFNLNNVPHVGGGGGGGYHHLQILRLYGWPKLKSLPDQLQHLTALQSLSIAFFDGLEALPDWLGNLSSLQGLGIWYCKNVKYLPSVESMRPLTNLREIYIYECPLLKERCTKQSGPEWSKISHIPSIEIDRVTIQDLTAASSSS